MNTVTPAQMDALRVLAGAPAGEWVDSHKRRSTHDACEGRFKKPTPRVNATAVHRLVAPGYVKSRIIPYASVFSSAFRYQITDAGRKLVEEAGG